LLIVFLTLDLFIFYIFFEAVLIPMFLMIGIWGSRGQKLKASLEFFYFTLLGSILLLIAILWLSNFYGTTNYLFLLTKKIPTYLQVLCWLSFFIGFAIKLPLFPFHNLVTKSTC
jgi:NADH-quinone oxidoreductase subunit M